MSSILEERIQELNKESWGNLLGIFFFTVPVYIAATLVFFLIFFTDAWWIALIAVTLLFVAGVISRLSSSYDQWRSFQTPLEVVSGGSYAVNREILKVTGTASVVSDFMLGGAGQLLKFITKRKLMAALREIQSQRVEDLVSELRRLGTRPRMHPIDKLPGYGDIIPALAAADIVWMTLEKRTQKVGLNSRYD